MAKIEEIDYDEIVNYANTIASNACSMQNQISLAFQEITSMSNDWYGKSYDDFVEVVNSTVTKLNKIAENTVCTIPSEIAAKARSYAQANQTEVSVAFKNETYTTLKDITKTNKGSKLRFKKNEVETDKKRIVSDFKSAEDFADKANKAAKSLESYWKSESGIRNTKELQIAFARIKSILELLEEALNNHITAQAETIETIENVADTIEAAGEVVDGFVDDVVDTAKSVTDKIKSSASQTWKNITGKN